MAELERELFAVSRRVDWPAEPDLAPRVRARMEARVERAVPWRRTLVIPLALLAVAIAAASALAFAGIDAAPLVAAAAAAEAGVAARYPRRARTCTPGRFTRTVTG